MGFSYRAIRSRYSATRMTVILHFFNVGASFCRCILQRACGCVRLVRKGGCAMTIRRVEGDKKRWLSLLLLADEQEDMVDRYLDRGTMYLLEEGGVRASAW